MQTYNFSLAAAASRNIPATGDLIVYESGTAAGAGDAHITIKPDFGDEIVLKPGQGVRFKQTATAFFIKVTDGASSVAGALVIGDGEFFDSNTNNKFTLDASFANNVTVMNTASNPVQITAASMAYTNSYASTAASVANTAIQMLAAATNVNGVVLNKFDIGGSATAGTGIVVLAKSTAPANVADGDVLFSGMQIAGGPLQLSLDIAKMGQPKVAAGKAIWYMSTAADGCTIRDALFTVL